MYSFRRLIAYIEDKDSFPVWTGYVLAVAFFVVAVFDSIMNNYRFYVSNNIGNRVKTVLSAAVYKKVGINMTPLLVQISISL